LGARGGEHDDIPVEGADGDGGEETGGGDAFPVTTPVVPSDPPPPPPQFPPDGPDLAIVIVSELKANAALFAAFAFGALNLPPALTVSESKVTSVTTSVSVARPLPDSELLKAFVVLDAVTLCLMISCVAASQLLIYRLADGSWYTALPPAGTPSALGRLVTTYRAEFTVARLTFDLGVVSLLLAVAVRAVAVFDRSIFEPVAAVIFATSVAVGIAYVRSYREVFRPAEQEVAPDRPGADGGLARRTVFVGAVALPILALASYREANRSDTAADLSERIRVLSSAAGESKLRVVVERVAEERDGTDGREKKRFLGTERREKNKQVAATGNKKKEKVEREKIEKAVTEKAAAEKMAEKAPSEKGREKVHTDRAAEKAIGGS